MDKKVKTGAYTFPYASLGAILDVVIPALMSEGVMLVQKVDSPTVNDVSVESVLLGGEPGDKVSSGLATLTHGGKATDMAKCVTSLRRIQLLALLSLAAEEDEAPLAVQRQASTPSSRPNPTPQGGGSTNVLTPQAQLELERKLAQRGQALTNSGASSDLKMLALQVRNEDAKEGEPMSTNIAEGKNISAFDYVLKQVEGVVGKGKGTQALSYLYGRVVNTDSPPTSTTRFLYNEVIEGKHKTTLGEVRTIIG